MRPSVAALLLLSSWSALPAARAQDLRERFARWDRDGDGAITAEELPRPRLFARLDRDGDGRLTLAEVEQGLGESDGVAPTGSAVRVVRDVPYRDGADGDRLQTLDLYLPAAAGPHPVVVFVHGGGWRTGDKRNAAAGAEKGAVFTREGFLYVSLNYRLSPAVQHPAHVQDVAAGIAWVTSHAASYGGDPRRVAVMGHSAGAHLAALVASDPRWLKAHGLGLDALSGCVLLDGAGYDIPAQLAASGRGGTMRAMYESAFGEDPAGQRDASPITHVAPGQGTPPFLILHVARREDSRRASLALSQALLAAGAEARVVPAAGKTHATINRELGRPGDPVTAEVLGFLRARLSP